MATTFFVQYPSTPVSISAIGTNGALAPTTSMEVGGVGADGNLHPLSTTNTGVLNVNVSSTTTTPLPVTDAAAEASLSSIDTKSTTIATNTGNTATSTATTATNTGNTSTSVASIDGKTPTVGQKLMAASSPVVLASDQSSIPVAATIQAGTAIIGKVSIDQTTPGTTNGVQVNSSALPAGAATQTTLASIDTKTPTQGQALMASSSPVVIASNQSAVPTTDNTLDTFITGAGPATQVINTNILLAVTGTTALDLQGSRSIAFQVITAASTTAVVVNFEASNDNVNFIAVGMYDKTTPTAAPVTTFTTAASTQRYFEGPTEFRYFRVRLVSAIVAGSIQAFTICRASTYQMTQNSLAAGTQVIGALSANQTINNAQINGVTPLMGNGVTGTGSQRVTIASDNTAFSVNAVQSGTWTVQPGNTPNTTAWLMSEEKAATATCTNVASSATSVSILASTPGRKQATFFNDSTQVLYLKFGATASTTSYTVQLIAGAYYELPGVRVYTGAIDGIWASANGNLRVTELT